MSGCARLNAGFKEKLCIHLFSKYLLVAYVPAVTGESDLGVAVITVSTVAREVTPLPPPGPRVLGTGSEKGA